MNTKACTLCSHAPPALHQLGRKHWPCATCILQMLQHSQAQ